MSAELELGMRVDALIVKFLEGHHRRVFPLATKEP